MTEKTVEQLRREAAQAAIHAQELDKQAKEAALRAKEAAEQQEAKKRQMESVARQRVILNALVSEIKSQVKARKLPGLDIEVRERENDFGNYQIWLAGLPVIAEVTVQEESTGTFYRRNANGKLRVYIGTYGDKKMFPQLKDGSFSYEKIVAEILDRVEKDRYRRERAARDAETRSKSNEIVERLKAKYESRQHGCVVQGATYAPNKVRVSFDGGLTEEQADQVLALLVAFKVAR